MKYLRVIMIVLLLGCCTLWVASYWNISWYSRDGLHEMNLWDGGYSVVRYEFDIRGSRGLNFFPYAVLPEGWWPVVRVFNYPHVGVWGIRGTFWLPTLLLALPLAISASPWSRRRRRAKQGLCIRCGYDLSGTDHSLCPECGEEIRKGNPA